MTQARISRRGMLAATAAAGLVSALPGRALAGTVSTSLFRDVMLVDGTGSPAIRADVFVRGDAIARIGAVGSIEAGDARVIVGDGRVLAPGFIDLHTHGDPLEQSFESYLAMGCTTIVLGQDGGNPAVIGAGGAKGNLRDWMARIAGAAIDVNVATLAGHGALRRAAGISDAVRRPDADAMKRMTDLLDLDMRAGAFGLSYGLEYVPGVYSETPELAALGRVASRYDAVVMSHMRSEDDDRIIASIEELIGSSLPARPHISHLKVMYVKGEARAEELLRFIEDKRRGGIALSADAYPYNAGYTGVAIIFPDWALPPTDYKALVAARRQELRDYLEKRMIRRGGPDAFLFGTAPYAGKTLAQAADEAGLHFADFLVRIGPDGGAGAHFTIDQALQDRLLIDPNVAISTDGAPTIRHPRSTGTYAKLIEDYVVGKGRLTIEEAVRKATSLPARIMRFEGRGVIKVGAKADLILFDPARIRARSTYTDPFAHAEGFDHVMVNGVTALESGRKAASAGALIRRVAA